MNIDIKIPSRWSELADAQAALILSILNIAHTLTEQETLTITALRITGIRLIHATQQGVLIKIPASYVTTRGHRGPVFTEMPYQRLTSLISSLRWILDMPSIPWRPTRLMNARTTERHLNDLTYGQWLRLDTLYRAYIRDQDPAKMQAIIEILVPGARRQPVPWETHAILMWLASIKSYLSARYPDLFKPAPSGTSGSMAAQSTQANIDAQLRALTQGDPLKEDAILALPLHRALTELNAQAAEYARIKALSKK